jgi:succinate-acetate transporter protein
MANNGLANPAPLGLMGFGMTTVLLNLHNAGLFTLGSMILAMGIFYGGIAQVIAGIMEFKKGNTFGMTAFCSFGMFWLSLVFLLLAPQLGWWTVADTQAAMASYLFIWGIFTLGMFFGTLKSNRVLQLIFISLTILFFLLALGQYNATVHTIAGFEGIICGSSAIYLAFAEIVNEANGRTVLPVFPVKPKEEKRVREVERAIVNGR